MNKPIINVTPLIDVLLVLLIIFMVVAPLKPGAFKVRAPSEPKHIGPIITHPDTLVVNIGSDASLKLNSEPDLGTTDDPSKMIDRVKEVFGQRMINGNVSASFADDPKGDAGPHRTHRIYQSASLDGLRARGPGRRCSQNRGRLSYQPANRQSRLEFKAQNSTLSLLLSRRRGQLKLELQTKIVL